MRKLLWIICVGASFWTPAISQTISVIPGPAAFASKSGNTNIVGTVSGTLTNGHCVSIDGNMNLVDAGGACTTGGGGGTVSAGSINQLGVYASTGTTISGLATANSGVLVTSGAGVPSISTTLPNGLALGTPGSVTLTNGTGLPIAGITGLGTGVGTALAAAVSGSGGMCLTTNCVLITPTLGVATVTSINKVAITVPATGSTLTIADGKTLTDTSGVGANLLLGATGGGFTAYGGVTCTNQFLRVLSSAGAGTCASVAIGSDVSGLGTGVATWLGTPSSANLAAAVTDETGSGALAFATSPSFTTPSLGAATATTINSVTIPSGADTVDLLGTAQTITATKTFNTSSTMPAILASTSASGITPFVRALSTGNLPNGGNGGIVGFGSLRTSDSTIFAPAFIVGVTTQAWTAGTNEGMSLQFYTSPNNTTTSTLALTLGQDQTAKWSGTIPTVTGTGTPTIVSGSTDTAGEVTSGTSATSVVITFATAKANAPFCNVTPKTQLVAFQYDVSTTAITITQTATTGEKIVYSCWQH